MPFLFTKTGAERALCVYEDLDCLARDYYSAMTPTLRASRATVEASLEAYDFFCQKYFGLGFVASFIPGTEAYQTRMILSGEVEQLSRLLTEKLNTEANMGQGARERYRDRMTARWLIVFLILDLPSRIRMDAFVFWRREMHRYSNLESFKKLASYLPVLSSIYDVGPIFGATSFYPYNLMIDQLINILCNPVQLVDHSLWFLLSALNRIIEIGSEKYQESGPIRKALKGFVGVVFSAIMLPVRTVSAITDIPYQVLKWVIYPSLQFLAASLKQMIRNEDQIIVEHRDAAAMEALGKKAALRQIAAKRQEAIASGITAASQKKTVMIDDLTAIIANYRYQSLTDDGVDPEPLAIPSHPAAGPRTPGAGLDVTADPVAAHKDADLVNFPAYGDISPEQAAQYGLPVSKPVPSLKLSRQFRLFKTTPHDKGIIRELVDIVHANVSKEASIEAARQVLTRSATQPSR